MKRHLAIGDIHGCYHALRTLCDFVELRSDDTIITLGDYPNRGPNTTRIRQVHGMWSYIAEIRPSNLEFKLCLH